MSYQVNLKWEFNPENPDSLFNDVAWVATIIDDSGDLVCDVFDAGNNTGRQIIWFNQPAKDKMLIEADAMFPDSIDLLRDYLDHLIETNASHHA